MADGDWIESLTTAQAHVVRTVQAHMPGAMIALFLAGSLGRNTSDRFSDIDFVAIAARGRERELLHQWLDMARTQFRPVMEKVAERPQTIINLIDPEWTRIDLAIHPADRPFERARESCRPIHDPENIWLGLAAKTPARGPDRGTVERIVVEFIRILGLLTVVIGRGELAVGVTGAGLLRQQLIALMVEERRTGDPEGALHLNRLLDAEQRAGLEALPPLSADAGSIIGAHLACARIFLPRARMQADRVGMEWPAAFETATMRALARAGIAGVTDLVL